MKTRQILIATLKEITDIKELALNFVIKYTTQKS